ncbi:retrotransposon protein, putative, ty1-copia subclass [Tanacetum coccineum]
MVRSMMSQTTLPKSFWDYALETAARILNMVLTKKVEKTPYEVWHGQAPKLSYLKVWGCEALVKRDTLTKPDKLEPSLINQEASGSLEDLEIIQEEDTHPSIDTSLNHEEDDLEIDEPQSDIIPIRRSTRTRRPTDRMCLYIDAEEHELGDLGEPANYKAALLDPESDKWLTAMNVEMQSMKDTKLDLVELPPNGKTIGSKWIFKKKTKLDGVVHKTFKDRLVAIGFTLYTGIDYEDTFSPVAALVNTKDMFLVYGGDLKRELGVSSYTNAGYLTDVDDLKSQTGYVFVLNGGAIDWKSAKQSIFATSSAEAEYIAAFDASKEAQSAIANESGITRRASISVYFSSLHSAMLLNLVT